MPPIKTPTFRWPTDRSALSSLGKRRVGVFCTLNDIPVPEIEEVPKSEWAVGACAYYRPDEGIKICLEECARPAPHAECRNWNWPGSVTDREPYGVLCHELGHHCDWIAGTKRGSYGSEYSQQVMKTSGEKPVTSYCPNPWEWFAEIFRVFVTNPVLLRCIRPKTYRILTERWKPVPEVSWRRPLGVNVPDRIVRTLVNKGAY